MSAECPTSNELRRLLQDEPVAEAVAEHLNSCEACQRTAEFLTRSLEPLVQELPLLLEPPERSRVTAAIQTDFSESTVDEAGSDSDVQDLNNNNNNSSDTTFARHRLLGLLGSGGMGVVCLAEHVGLGAKRAIKFLSPKSVTNPEAIDRFRREWRSIGQIEHPHLAKAFDCGEEAGLHFLTLEYIEGLSLQQLTQQSGPLSPGQAAEAGRQMAAGLAAMHERGFTHRDVKPSNAVLGHDGVVRIIDLGLACLNEGIADDLLTGDHQLVGSPAYMAPEQFQKSGSRDARSDLYSLGCTLFTLLTGSAPYVLSGRSVWDIAADHAAPFVPDVRDQRSDVPVELAQIVQRLMSPAPAQRPVDAATVERELARCSDGRELAELAARSTTHSVMELPPELLARLNEALGSDSAGAPTVDLKRDGQHRSGRSASDESGTVARPDDDAAAGSGGEVTDRTGRRSAAKTWWLLAGLPLLLAGLLIVTELTGLTALSGLRELTGLNSSSVGSRNEGTTATGVAGEGVAGEGVGRESGGPATGAAADSAESVIVATTIVDPAEPARPPERSLWPVRQLADRPAEPRDWLPHEPLSVAALTQAPVSIPGVQSWSWETRSTRGWINTVRRSFDGTRVAFGGGDGCLRIYSLPDLELHRILSGHVSIESVRWQTDSTLIAADAGGTVRLWNVDRGHVPRTWDNQATPTFDADLSPDGTRVAIAGVEAGARVAGIDDREFTRLHLTGQTFATAWSPTDDLLGTTNELTFRLFRIGDSYEEVSSKLFSRRVTCVEWQPDGQSVAVVAESGSECVLINAADGRVVAEFKLPSGSAQLCRWSPDGRQLAILTRRQLVIVSRSGETLAEITLTSGTLRTICWLDNQSLLGSRQFADGVVIIDVPGASLRLAGLQHSCPGTFVRARSDRRLVASGGGLFEVRPDAVTTFPPIRNQPRQTVFGLGLAGADGVVLTGDHQSVQWSEGSEQQWQNAGCPVSKLVDIAGHPTENLAAVLYENGDLWLASHGQTSRLFRKLERIDFHSEVAWSPDGKWLGVGRKGGVAGWRFDPDSSKDTFDPASPQPAFDIDWTINEGGSGLAWSPDSTMIATKSKHGVRVFSVSTGEDVALLTGQTHYFNYGIAWSPDGRYVAALTVTSLRLWSTETWQQSLVIPVNSSLTGSRPLAWHPSGKSLLHVGIDAVCREYDVATGKCLSTSLLLSRDQYAVFAPDGQRLQSTGLDDELVAIVNTESGQRMLTIAEFEALQASGTDAAAPLRSDVCDEE